MSSVLLGCAIGDALGMPFEMMKPDNPILVNWDGKTYLPSQPRTGGWIGGELKAGQYTDDTDMQIMVAESLIENKGFNPKDMSERYVDWIVSGKARGYGKTTALAVKRLQDGAHWSESGVEGSYGNGTAMRAAPFGVYFRDDMKTLIEVVKIDSAITHKSADAEAGALAIALVAYYAANASTPNDLAPFFKIVEYLPQCEVESSLRSLLALAASDVEPKLALWTLGTGADVKQTVPAALYCYLKFSSYEEAVVAAIRAGGDTDTTAAIVGSLFGAEKGSDNIPKNWVEGIEDRSRLMILDSQLFNRSNSNFFTK